MGSPDLVLASLSLMRTLAMAGLAGWLALLTLVPAAGGAAARAGAATETVWIEHDADSPDAVEGAFAIRPGPVYAGTAGGSDADGYVLQVNAAGVYLITLEAPEEADLDLLLVTPQRTLQSILGPGRIDRIRWYLAPGAYLVRVVPAGEDEAVTYRLQVTQVPDVRVDGNERAVEAVALVAGEAQGGRMDGPGDVDFFTIDVPPPAPPAGDAGVANGLQVLEIRLALAAERPDAAYELAVEDAEGALVRRVTVSGQGGTLEWPVRPGRYRLLLTYQEGDEVVAYRIVWAAYSPEYLKAGTGVTFPAPPTGGRRYFLAELLHWHWKGWAPRMTSICTHWASKAGTAGFRRTAPGSRSLS